MVVESVRAASAHHTVVLANAVAVASGTDDPTPPCGACLQVLAEFGGPDLPVVLAGARGEVVRTLGELMPHGFGKAFLGKGRRG